MSEPTLALVEKKRSTCVVVEDNAEVRGVFCSLAEQNGLQVIGDADDGRAGLEIILRHNPDLVVVDLLLPSLPGSQVIAKSRRKLPNTKFIVITGYSSGELFNEATAAGPNAFLIKPVFPPDFAAAVTAVLAGRPAVSGRILEILWDAHVARVTQRSVAKLTRRHEQVVRLMAEGLSSKEISAELKISIRTVEKHRSDARKRIGVRSTGELAAYAVKSGLTK